MLAHYVLLVLEGTVAARTVVLVVIVKCLTKEVLQFIHSAHPSQQRYSRQRQYQTMKMMHAFDMRGKSTTVIETNLDVIL